MWESEEDTRRYALLLYRTGPDGATTSYGPIPEDAQTLELSSPEKPSLRGLHRLAGTHLAVTDGAKSLHSSLTGSQTFTGVTFSTASPFRLCLPTAGRTQRTQCRLVRGYRASSSGISRSRQRQRHAGREPLIGTLSAAQTLLGLDQRVGGHAIPMAVVSWQHRAYSTPGTISSASNTFTWGRLPGTSWPCLAGIRSKSRQARVRQGL